MDFVRKAIFETLTTNGTIPVYNRSSSIPNPANGPTEEMGYAVIWEETQPANEVMQGGYNFRVAVHYAPGYIDSINEYLRKLTDWFKSPIEVTIGATTKSFHIEPGETSSEVGNDDGTVSRDRLLSLPAWG